MSTSGGDGLAGSPALRRHLRRRDWLAAWPPALLPRPFSSLFPTASALLPFAVRADQPGGVPAARQPLDVPQSRAFRLWFVAIVEDQVQRPSPRWVHRDCAGLVRFAVDQAWRSHDAAWLHAMGWDATRPRPPELDLSADQRAWSQAWLQADGQRAAFASALAIVQHNTRFVGKTRTQAQPGDLLFFDQGDDQHLMVWTGRHVAYHNGAEPRPDDNGLRHLSWERLLAWPDTRWRPEARNPNFAGLFRLGFLSA